MVVESDLMVSGLSIYGGISNEKNMMKGNDDGEKKKWIKACLRLILSRSVFDY